MSSEVVQMLVAERRELAEFCARLTVAQWEAPSLCENWRVRDVVAHLVGNFHDWNALWPPTNFQRMNDRRVAKRHDWPIARLLAEVVEAIQPPALLKVGPLLNYVLYDSWVHQQDMRWPLNLPRSQDPARMKVLLKTALQAGPAAKQIQGTRLVANDFEWTHGTGPEIVGPSEALVMMLANRPSAWERLEGAGVVQRRPR